MLRQKNKYFEFCILSNTYRVLSCTEKKIILILEENDEIQLKTDSDNEFRKVLVLSIAS